MFATATRLISVRQISLSCPTMFVLQTVRANGTFSPPIRARIAATASATRGESSGYWVTSSRLFGAQPTNEQASRAAAANETVLFMDRSSSIQFSASRQAKANPTARRGISQTILSPNIDSAAAD